MYHFITCYYDLNGKLKPKPWWEWWSVFGPVLSLVQFKVSSLRPVVPSPHVQSGLGAFKLKTMVNAHQGSCLLFKWWGAS